MKSKTWMWLILLAVPAAGLAQYAPEPYVTGSVDAQFQSKYLFRGFKVFGNQTAMQIAGNVELADTGLGAEVQSHFSNGGGYVADQRWDYNPYYHGVIGADEPYMLEYRLNYVWYNYSQRSYKVADQQEANVLVSMPMVFGIEGLAPRYQGILMWQSKSGTQSVVGNSNGWLHVFGLDYNIELPGLTPEMPTQPIGLMAEIVYNDGTNPIPGTHGRTNSAVDHDWSHWVVGATADFDLGYDITLTPAVYYQRTMEPDLRPFAKQDEVWVTVGAKWRF